MNSLPFKDIRPLTVRNKIAFLLNAPDLLHHFGPVLRQFEPHEVDLLVYSHDRDTRAIEAQLKHLPYAWYRVDELFQTLTGYRVLVSNHMQGVWETFLPAKGEMTLTQGYLLRPLGIHNVRLMYGYGTDIWNLADWNQLYDAFLCHGPIQAAQLAPYRGQKVQVGYPRYDAFFTESFDRDVWLARLGCDPKKPVVVWLSTQKKYRGALNHHAAAISRLIQDYNVLVKPHPFSWKREPEYLKALEAHTYTRVIREDFDNLILYQLADYLLTDYGGTIFSALYTDCKLILLDLPDETEAVTDDPLLADTEQWVRRFLVHLGPDQTAQLPILLQSEQLWAEQKATRAWLRDQLFPDTYGHSARIAAEWLRNPLQLLKNADPTFVPPPPRPDS